MSAYLAHIDGDCGPGCPVCPQGCDVCGRYLGQCTCPQLPIDTEDQP